MKTITRRETLHLVVLGTVALGAGCYLGSAQTAGPVGDTSAGNLSALPVGTLRALPVGTALAIGRDENGVYALTTICTHEQCDVATNGTIDPSGMFCSCHGSRFDAQGNVLVGPALRPLAHYAVTIDPAGEITIHGSQIVDPAARLTV